MSIPICTKHVKVISKFSKSGESKTYYNLKIADTESYDNQIVGVPAEVFDSVSEGDMVTLVGAIGGLKEKYWYFDDFIPVKDK